MLLGRIIRLLKHQFMKIKTQTIDLNSLSHGLSKLRLKIPPCPQVLIKSPLACLPVSLCRLEISSSPQSLNLEASREILAPLFRLWTKDDEACGRSILRVIWQDASPTDEDASDRHCSYWSRYQREIETTRGSGGIRRGLSIEGHFEAICSPRLSFAIAGWFERVLMSLDH